ncbi:MAG: hypothetical protein Q7U45_05085 [Burkholderiaceae bacterium]|nr:hypothetical protein [Burkholderiaceae bacterium]MDZ4162935.1 hypothetical protein [Burkholderiales bacterium]
MTTKQQIKAPMHAATVSLDSGAAQAELYFSDIVSWTAENFGECQAEM